MARTVNSKTGFGTDCVKRVELSNNKAELLVVENEGFYIYAIFQEHVFFERLHTESLVEACKQFNQVVKTLKA